MEARLTITADVGGETMLSTITRTGDGHAGFQKDLAAAMEGDLTTRTTDTTGTITMDAAHGFSDGDVIDLYWTVGGVEGRRYDVDLGTPTGDAFPISGGAGDVLPAQDSEIIAQVQTVVNVADFEGDLLQMIAAHSVARGRMSLWGSGPTLHLGLDMVPGELWYWLSGGTEANPLAGDTITEVRITQGSSAGTCLQKLGTVHDTE
ncbi:MAG: hypothetical protein GY778_13650 [bacterium]|nr:hypothetical protein [bacterium]